MRLWLIHRYRRDVAEVATLRAGLMMPGRRGLLSIEAFAQPHLVTPLQRCDAFVVAPAAQHKRIETQPRRKVAPIRKHPPAPSLWQE